MTEIEYKSEDNRWFCINGRRDSSAKWKWIKSKNDFFYTNWASGYSDNDSGKGDHMSRNSLESSANEVPK